MRRAGVALPDGIWKIIDKDWKDKKGLGDSEAIRTIVLNYLSEHGYFVNPKGESEKEEIIVKLNTLEDMLTAVVDVLQEKGYLTIGEWNTAIEAIVERKASRRRIER